MSVITWTSRSCATPNEHSVKNVAFGSAPGLCVCDRDKLPRVVFTPLERPEGVVRLAESGWISSGRVLLLLAFEGDSSWSTEQKVRWFTTDRETPTHSHPADHLTSQLCVWTWPMVRTNFPCRSSPNYHSLTPSQTLLRPSR